MMAVHFPMAFLMGSAAFDVAAAVGLAVPAVVAGYLLVAGLATGILAAAPGAVDFVTTVRPAGGRSATKPFAMRFSAWLLLCWPSPGSCAAIFQRLRQ